MRMHLTRSWSRRGAVAAMAVAALAGTSACSSSAPASSPAPSASPTGAASGRHMSAPDFSNAVDKPSTIVLDVRTPAEYATGHLSGAENIDMQGADFATRIATLDKKATYAVYCHSGRRSGEALEQMAADGFTQVFDLAGGITAWQANGGTLEMIQH